MYTSLAKVKSFLIATGITFNTIKPFGWFCLIFFPFVAGYLTLDAVEGNPMLTGRITTDWWLDAALPLIIFSCMSAAGFGAGKSLYAHMNSTPRAWTLGAVFTTGLGVSAVSLAIRIWVENGGAITTSALQKFETIGAGVLPLVSLLLMSLAFAFSTPSSQPSNNRQPA